MSRAIFNFGEMTDRAVTTSNETPIAAADVTIKSAERPRRPTASLGQAHSDVVEDLRACLGRWFKRNCRRPQISAMLKVARVLACLED